MATYYIYEIKQPTRTYDIQMVRIGDKSIEVEFQWAIASAEQLSIIVRRFIDLARTDPIYRKDGTIDREYNYVEYYYDLSGKDLNTWLDTDPELPRSLASVSREQQVEILSDRIRVCVGMMPIIQQYTEVLRWQAVVTCNGHKTVAVVQPGGWFQNQDNSFAFRFLSTLEYIGKDELGSVVMQFEVYDE